MKVPLCSSMARAYGDSEMPNYTPYSACLEPVVYCRSPDLVVLSMVKSHCLKELAWEMSLIHCWR